MTWIKVGSCLGLLVVVIGAFGAHGLEDRLEKTGYAEQFQTGVKYHMFHVVGILLAGLLAHLGLQGTGNSLAWSPWCFLLGILLFSGSLYVLAVTGARWLGAITPIGGLLFIAGWIGLALVRSPAS